MSAASLAAGAAFAQDARPAPDFKLLDVDGKSVTLSSLKGKLVFLDFWASWCAPCRNSIPAVEKLYQKYKNDKIVFLGINLENNPDSTKRFASNTGMSYQILVGNQKTVSAYGVRGIPAFFLIDHDGKIARSYVGFQSDLADRWDTDIRDLLSKIPAQKKNAKPSRKN